VGAVLLIIVAALFALDAWLKSWPIKVMAPCDAEMTVMYAPGFWGQWQQLRGVRVEYPEREVIQTEFMDTALPASGAFLANDAVMSSDVTVDSIAYFGGMNAMRAFDATAFGMGYGFWLQTIPGAIGRHYVLARRGDWVGLYFSPGLLGWAMMPWPLFSALMYGEHADLSDEFLLQHDGGFSLSSRFESPPLVEWRRAEEGQGHTGGSVISILDATGRTTVLVEHDYALKALRSLWVRIPDALAATEGTSVSVSPAQDGVVFHLDSASPELGRAILDSLTLITSRFDSRSCYRPLRFLARYPGLESLSGEAKAFRATMAFPKATAVSHGMTVELSGLTVAIITRQLETSGLLNRSVPREFGGMPGLALPPSFLLKEPVMGWGDGRVLLASSSLAMEDTAKKAGSTAREAVAVLQVAALPLYYLESAGRLPSRLEWLENPPSELFQRQELVGHVRQIARQELAGNWITFHAVDEERTEPPAMYHPVAPCNKDEVGVVASHPAASIWPIEAWQTVHALLTAGKSYEAMKAFTETQIQRDDIFGRDEPGGIHYPATSEWAGDSFRSESPLVTQTAWSILTTSELYAGFDVAETRAFREEQWQAMEDWSNFLVRWKRGPDAAPLSCIEESAGPDDVYPLLVVYLGLRAGADWFYPDGSGMPEAWQLRLDDLRTELLASLLQPGQCLTCPDLLMPIAESRGQLSPAALDALHRLPACPPPEREDYGVLPRCAP
jgi:hypothetical protein